MRNLRGSACSPRPYPDGRATTYTYDKADRIKTQTTNSKATSYAYDPAGNLTTVTLPTTTARSETRTYDEAGRLAALTTPTLSNTYTYDENDRLVTDKPSTGYPTRFTYDDAGRMTRVCTDTSATSCLTGTTGNTYTYDKVGNLKTSALSGTTTTYAYDAGDQLSTTTAGTTTTSYTYDADGNQTKDDDGTYTYDPAGRIKTATIGTNAYSFLHDADGNRTTVNKNNTLAGTSRWDLLGALPQIATDTDASGALTADYHYDPDGTARSMDRTAGTYYFTQDRQNSVSTVYDSAGVGNYRYTYTPWGTTTGKATITGGQTSPYGYTGQYKDQYIPDRLQLRARSYDTDQNRFTTQDPVAATPDNPNQSPYNYADNDPANLADPSGNCPMCIGAGLGAIVSGGVYALTHQDDFDWGDFAAATAQGAVVGAVGGFLAPAGTSLAAGLGLQGGRALAVAAVTDAAIGMGLTWAINTAQCQPTTPMDLLVGALTGGLANFVKPAWGALRGLFGKPVATVPPRVGPGAAHAGDPSLLPKGEASNPFLNRADAEAAAFSLAGVPHGAVPDAAWIVTGNVKLAHAPGYFYSSNPTHWGRFRQYETAQGSRVVVEHTFDKAGPHFHAGKPKYDSLRNFVNFDWNNQKPKSSPRRYDYEKYGWTSLAVITISFMKKDGVHGDGVGLR
ncbi:RHS repeat-associated core domain-containing protein [Streptomyces sp. NPDC002328]|uniref:RHS repeat-associated core domain-containing protein n=1 Tax=Streptomyces sp. NPDC002328 TaxID=3364642 RepID=UPI0036A5CCB9